MGWLERRDRDHHALWTQRFERKLAQERAKLQAEVDSLTEKISQLTTELEQRPIHVITENLDQDTVDEANAERDHAYSMRDRTFSTLSEIHVYHMIEGSGRCRCGLPYKECDTAKILDEYKPLAKWEAHQARLYGSRLRNYLPPNHPARINPRWRPNE